MNLEQLKLILTTNEPTENMLREYMADNCDEQHGHLHSLYHIVYMPQFGTYQGMQKLKLLIICCNLIQEFVVMDRILAIPNPIQPSGYYTIIMKQITKVYGRVSSADKYKKYDHVLNITYESIRKDNV